MAFDPAEFLKESPQQQGEKSTFDPEAFLAGEKKETPVDETSLSTVVEKGLQTIAPAVSNLVKGPVIPEGMAGKIASNLTPTGVIQSAADIAAMAHGHPPYGAMIRNALPNAADLIKKPLAESVPEYLQALKNVPSNALNSAKNAGSTILRGAGRVAGPIGLGMNAYDAAQYAQEAELGNRLAQGQGQQAQQNFRQLNPGYGQGFVNNLTPEEATAIIQNGTPRDIEAMGGQAALNALIRQKAAAKALQPIAPTPLPGQ